MIQPSRSGLWGVFVSRTGTEVTGLVSDVPFGTRTGGENLKDVKTIKDLKELRQDKKLKEARWFCGRARLQLLRGREAVGFTGRCCAALDRRCHSNVFDVRKEREWEEEKRVRSEAGGFMDFMDAMDVGGS